MRACPIILGMSVPVGEAVARRAVWCHTLPSAHGVHHLTAKARSQTLADIANDDQPDDTDTERGASTLVYSLKLQEDGNMILSREELGSQSEIVWSVSAACPVYGCVYN